MYSFIRQFLAILNNQFLLATAFYIITFYSCKDTRMRLDVVITWFNLNSQVRSFLVKANAYAPHITCIKHSLLKARAIINLIARMFSNKITDIG